MTREEIIMDTLSNIRLTFSHESDEVNLLIQSGFYAVKLDVTEIVEKVIKDRDKDRSEIMDEIKKNRPQGKFLKG